MRLKSLIVAAALSIVGICAHAQVDADPLPGDPKLVIFQYDENNSFRIYTRPLATTHIQLDNDERVKVLALGDTAGWMTAQKDNNIFVKPRYPNTNTSGTLITTKRTYQFVFRSTTESGRWYQRVSFQNPSDMLIEVADVDRRSLAAATQPTEAANATVVENIEASRHAKVVSPELFNFNYEITGAEAIRPLNVFDDGNATYIQLRKPEDVPALFRLVGKDMELVDYILKGSNTLVVPRVMDAGLLKLGNQEVRFYNRNLVSKKLFGGYEVQGGR